MCRRKRVAELLHQGMQGGCPFCLEPGDDPACLVLFGASARTGGEKMNMRDATTLHLLLLNEAYCEQEKYRTDEHDHRTGHARFHAAVERVLEERVWFRRFQIVLGVASDSVQQHFVVREHEQSAAVIRGMWRLEYILRQCPPQEHQDLYERLMQDLHSALEVSGNLPLQESPW